MDAKHMTTQPTLRSLIAMESLKIRRRPMTKVMFGMISLGFALLMPIGYMLGGGRENPPHGFLFPDIVPNSQQMVGDVAGVLLVILAAAVIGSEHG